MGLRCNWGTWAAALPGKPEIKETKPSCHTGKAETDWDAAVNGQEREKRLVKSGSAPRCPALPELSVCCECRFGFRSHSGPELKAKQNIHC